MIIRGHHLAAGIGPPVPATGADLREALAGIRPPDDRFADDVADALAWVADDESDPWAEAGYRKL